MKTSLRLFLSSCIFSTVIGTVYWFASNDLTGTILLGLMACGFAFLIGYTRLAERHANLVGDREAISMRDTAGERLGIFTTRSPWPIVLALSVCASLFGLITTPAISVIAGAVFFYALWQLVKESA